MTKEFKLSEKLIKTSPNQFGWINEKDIKEFIRLSHIIGEKEVDRQGKINQMSEKENLFSLGKIQGVLFMLDRIDKLSGFSDEKEVQGE